MTSLTALHTKQNSTAQTETIQNALDYYYYYCYLQQLGPKNPSNVYCFQFVGIFHWKLRWEKNSPEQKQRHDPKDEPNIPVRKQSLHLMDL